MSVAVLLAVAFVDITMVALGAVPLDEATVAPVAMPVPVRAKPVIIPLRLDTAVMFKLPEVTTPVNELVPLAVAAVDSVIVLLLTVRVSAVTLEAVAAADITMVVPLAETTAVDNGMPTPEINRPAVTPVMLETPVTDVLPRVTMPVGVTVLEEVEKMVAPEAMPVPEMGCPFTSPAVLDT